MLGLSTARAEVLSFGPVEKLGVSIEISAGWSEVL
jgi:hypothetical protein